MTTAVIEKEAVGVRKNADSTENTQKDLRYFLALDYPIELVKDEESYVASHPDLPGCVSFGDDPNAAVERLQGIKKLWIEGQLQSGNQIPEPTEDEQFSGKFVLRVPKGLHRMADLSARREGVSLNAFIANVLAGALGYGIQVTHLGSTSTKANVVDAVNDHWHHVLSSGGKIHVWDSVKQKSGGYVRPYQSDFVGKLASQILTHQITKFVPDQSTEEYCRAKETQVRHKSSSGL